MPSTINKSDRELAGARKEALRGAVFGASKWGAIGVGLAVVGYFISPIYRGLTIQFKTYIQMSFMTFGCVLEGDRHMRRWEDTSRLLRRQAADEAVWKRWENLVQEEARLEQMEKGKSKSSRR